MLIELSEKETCLISQACRIWLGEFPDTGCKPSKIWTKELKSILAKLTAQTTAEPVDGVRLDDTERRMFLRMVCNEKAGIVSKYSAAYYDAIIAKLVAPATNKGESK